MDTDLLKVRRVRRKRLAPTLRCLVATGAYTNLTVSFCEFLGEPHQIIKINPLPCSENLSNCSCECSRRLTAKTFTFL